VEQTLVDLCILLAALHDGESTDFRKYKEQTEEIVFIIFFWGDGEGYQTYKDDCGALFLA